MEHLIIKAQTVKTTNWVYGYYIGPTHTDSSIHTMYLLQNDRINSNVCVRVGIEINPESICRPTGRKDRNDVNIYEHDRVKYAVKKKWCDCEGEQDLEFGTDKFCSSCGKKVEAQDFIQEAIIKFKNGGFTLYNEPKPGYYTAWQIFIAETFIEWIEVVGNWEPIIIKNNE